MTATDDRDDDERARALVARLEARGRLARVAFDGGHVAWRRFGDGGPPLVLLHGGHGSWLHWVRNVEALAGRFTVWVPDLPGYGDSDAPVAPTLDALVAATVSTLDTVVGEGTPVALAGFSFGGLVAAHVAARRGRVARLALLGPAGHGGVRRPRAAQQSWRETAEAADAAALAEVMRHNLLAHMLHDAAAVDALALRVHTDACLRTRFHSKRISRAGGLADALDRHRGPLLLAWGEHDVTAEPHEALRGLVEGRPERRGCVVPGAGHWVQYERADDINRLLLDRLGKERLET
jgi:pimeloyl-ACP methyl ester carboxylesterase